MFFSRSDLRNSSSSPLAITTLRARTCLRVAPYLKVRAPEALHAIAPPIVDSSSLVGSGANKRPAAAAVRFICPTKAPGSTLIVRAFSSGAEIPSSPRRERRIPLSVIEAAVVLVCAPAQVIAIRSLAAFRTTSITSSIDSGRATRSGRR